MLAIFNVVVPVFAIIALGYLAVRFKLYPRDGVRGLVAFVNNFATPCLLFNAMATADFSSEFNWGVIIPFYVGALVVFAVASIVSVRVFGQRPGEGVASGFTAMFTNTVLIGLPLLQRAYGDGALVTTFSIIAFHASVLITIGMLTMELVRRDGAPLHQALGVAAVRIVSNPLLWGIAAGAAANYFKITMPEPVDAFLVMMAAAVIPAALFGLGGALNEYRISESWAHSLTMSLLKLLLQPAIAYVLLYYVLKIDHEYARYGVLLAAMPSGINGYVFATYYNRSVNIAANTILISTVLSVLTVSGWLFLLGAS
jgi:malonate transporter and related proteins